MERFEPTSTEGVALDSLYDELVGHQGDMSALIATLDRRYRGSDTHALLYEVSGVVNPVDYLSGKVSDPSRAIAFRNGGLLALPIAYKLLGEGFLRRIAECEIVVDDYNLDADERARRQQDAVTVCEIGATGYDEAAFCHDFLEEHEDDITPQVEHQFYMRRGFGFIMYHVYRLLEAERESAYQTDLADMRREAEQAETIDWDGELEHLLSE